MYKEQYSPPLSSPSRSPTGVRARPGQTKEETSYNAAVVAALSSLSPANVGPMDVDSANFNYLRQAHHPAVASMFAQALHNNSALSSSCKRKASTPQKITRFREMAGQPGQYPLLQMPTNSFVPTSSFLPVGLFKNRSDERPASSSPNGIPAVPLPFVPPSVLSSLFHHQQMQQAAAMSSEVIICCTARFLHRSMSVYILGQGRTRNPTS